MGYHGAKIGNYWLDFHDSEMSNVRSSSKTRDYYKKKKITMTFEIRDFAKKTIKKTIKVPFTKIFKVEKDGTRYKFSWDGFDLEKVLFNHILNNRKKTIVMVTPYALALRKTHGVAYYLNSDFFNDVVVLSTKKRVYGVSIFDQILWLRKQCLEYNE